MNNIINIVFTYCFLVPLSTVKAYDQKLAKYWPEDNFDLIQNIDNGRYSNTIKRLGLPHYYIDCIRVKKPLEGASHEIIGMFFAHKLVPSFSPWDAPISYWSHKSILDTKNRTVGALLSDQYNDLKLSLIELYDASISLDDISKLNELNTLKILGLPKSGIVFDADFSFPPNLEVLVVRNSKINSWFFTALNKIANLKELVLINCSADLKAPSMVEFGYVYDKSWSGLPRVFKNIAHSLEKLVIEKSDPEIFNYLIYEKWPKLTHIHADIFDLNIFGLRGLLGEPDRFRSVFPKVIKINLYVIKRHIDEVQLLIFNHAQEIANVNLVANINAYNN